MNVCIVALPGRINPDIDSAADALAGFFLHWINSHVSTYLCVPNAASHDGTVCEDNFVLVQSARYLKKTIRATKFLAEMHTAKMPCDVLFLLAHGNPALQDPNPASLVFGPYDDAPSDVRIWASAHFITPTGRRQSAPEQSTTLNQVVGGSKLVVLQCCHCNTIIEQYLESPASMHAHEIFFFDSDLVQHASITILVACLIHQIESDSNATGSPLERAQRSILAILKIMHDCSRAPDQAQRFWDHLVSSRCVVMMQDAFFGQVPSFKIAGSMLRYACSVVPQQQIFDEFQKLTLIRIDPLLEHPQRITAGNVLDFLDTHTHTPASPALPASPPPLTDLLLKQLHALAFRARPGLPCAQRKYTKNDHSGLRDHRTTQIHEKRPLRPARPLDTAEERVGRTNGLSILLGKMHELSALT